MAAPTPPFSVPASEVEEARARAQKLLIGVIVTTCALSVFAFAAVGQPRSAQVAIAVIGAGYLPLLLLIRQRRLDLSAWAMVAWMVTAHSVAAWSFNGLYMLAMPHTLCLPLIASYVAGWRAGFGVSGLLAAQLAYYWISGREDLPADKHAMALAAVSVLVLLAAIAEVFGRQQRKAQTRLLEALRRHEQSEAARAQSERSLRQIIENAPDLILIHRAGAVIYSNRRLAQALGHPCPTVVVGRKIEDLVHLDDRAKVRARLQQYAAGGVFPPAEFRMLRVDGSLLFAEWNVFIADYEGAPALIGLGRDLTERKRLDARLAVSDRMASVGTLAAGVAHELNNPLAFVTANLSYVRSELNRTPEPTAEQRDEWHQALEEAEDGARRMKSIIVDLKTYSRADETNVDSLDVAKVIRTTLRMAENEIRHRARLVLELSPSAFVKGNEAKLGQVVLNIVVNAAQAIRAGEAERHRITVRTVVEAGRAKISISDTGRGIPPDQLPRIFDPFFTTKPVGEGTGLGLFICHNLVTAMGGKLQVASEVGQGTTLTVDLPAEQEVATVARRPERVLQGPACPRVLVIDDEPLVGRGVKRTLLHHEVTLAESAAAALALLRDGHCFDVILCDLMMPEMDGAQFHAELEKLDPGALSKVLFLTAGAFTPDAQGFLDSGKAWLAKPYDSEGLRRAVRSVASGARVLAA